MAAIPRPAASRSSSTGKCWAASHSSALGASFLAANAAAVSVMTRSSSSRPKSCMQALLHCRYDELGAVFDTRGPTLRHGLDLGVELDRRGAVLVEIAEAGPLPAAEGVVGHRHRDRYVDADHAHLDTGHEVAGGVAVAGENRYAVAVFVFGRQPQRVFVVVCAHDAQHRAEDLVGVDRHVGGDVVEERGPDEEALLQAGVIEGQLIGGALAAVDHQ